MKSHYDSEENCKVFNCPACGHTYHEYYDNRSYTNTEAPFLQSVQPLLYNKQHDYAPSECVKLTQYICPKCGTLQIDLNDI